ncbi:MAG: cation:proton antiporter [Candidatus Aenigmarchaeota archaeon]|nr:cation:proton antiporter [Candidatus Aenigmarchaeota archaeon]
MLDSFSLLALFGVTIIVGYIGYLFFDKTRIPDVFWLIIFGILVGPVLNLVDRALFVSISPFLAALALLIILFDAGLNMDFYKMLRSFPRSILLAVLGMVLSAAAASLIAYYFIGLGMLQSILLGTIVGGTSSDIVTTLVRRLRMHEKPKMLVTLESIFTDPVVIVFSIVLLNIASHSGTQVSPVQGVLSAFSIGAVIGLIAGLVWLFVLDKLKGRPFDYMLTLAVLFLIYVFVESASGSGAIAALAFGLVLGNGGAFSTMLRMKRRFGFSKLLRTFQNEVSFFIRAFFFVYLGIIVTINTTYLVYGLAISAALIIARLVAVQLTIYKMNLTGMEKNVLRTMAPRGLAAAVLAQLPAAYGIPGAALFSDIVFIVILATVLYTTIATRLFYK